MSVGVRAKGARQISSAVCFVLAWSTGAGAIVDRLSQPRGGDLDQMLERRVIRALVAPSRTQYWIDRGKPVGAQVELLTQLEQELNRRYPGAGKHVRLHVALIPTPPSRLIPALLAGEGDLVAGPLTVTPERTEQADFAEPFFRGVAEIVVTGPGAPELRSLDDLAGKPVCVRRSSSYWSHLEALNQRFLRDGLPAMELEAAPEDLLDDDLLQMVDAGLIGITVVDRYAGVQWAKILRRLRARDDLRVHEGGAVGWMVRKDAPKLKEELSLFARKHGQGTAFGNILLRKYAASARTMRPATAPRELKKFQSLAAIFRKYGERYDLDYLLLMAQGYQESRLDHAARSAVGAIGVMQVMPATGKEMKTGDVTQLEPNIHAGVKYIRFLQTRYFEPLPMDALNKTLFTFAAYNAGPARIAQLRARAEKKGLDPNVWVGNTELVAAERIGAETVTYVANIYKYYVAYKLMDQLRAQRARALESVR